MKSTKELNKETGYFTLIMAYCILRQLYDNCFSSMKAFNFRILFRSVTKFDNFVAQGTKAFHFGGLFCLGLTRCSDSYRNQTTTGSPSCRFRGRCLLIHTLKPAFFFVVTPLHVLIDAHFAEAPHNP